MPCLPEAVQAHRLPPILITGASSGIGASTALRLNSLGYPVIANGRDSSRLQSVRQQAVFPECFYLERRDLLADISGLSTWVADLRAAYGKLGGMVFAAGKTITAPFMQYERENALHFFDLLCHVPIQVAKALCDRRNCVDSGTSLVFVAAAAAVTPNKGQLVYGAAKAALVCAARCMSKELAGRGIRANCISPGLVKTPMLEKTCEKLGDIFLQKEEPLYPLGLGEPGDIAELAAFLISPASRWLTGQNIILDGGRLA